MLYRRRAIVVLTLLLLMQFTGTATAQSSWDLFDPVYSDLETWEIEGRIPPLPWLRPYPPQLIREMLEIVAATGGTDADRARRYLSRIDRPFKVTPSINQRVRLSSDEIYAETSPTVRLSFILPALSADAAYAPHLLDDESGAVLPPLVRDTRHWVYDRTSFDLFGRTIDIRQNQYSNTAIGGGNIWFQAGIGRNSFGPFFRDGAVLSPYAPRTGRFSLTWHAARITYQLALLELTATDDAGGGRYPDKHLVFHSVQMRFAPWLEGAFYETVVYGNRFDPRYLVPVSVLFLTQGLGGFVDNALIGAAIEFKPTSWLTLPLNVYADDIHFNDIVSFNFDTKYKLSAQIGVKMSPPWVAELEMVSLEYLAVMPYMYSHRDEDTTVPNFSNYTHYGSSLGPSLDPNSDRIAFVVEGRPHPLIRAQASVSFSRHGNPSEGITDGDGSIFDDGYDGGTPTFDSETRFLIQDVLERTIAAGLRVDTDFDAGPFRITAGVGYTFSHLTNAGLSEGTVERLHHVEFSAAAAY